MTGLSDDDVVHGASTLKTFKRTLIFIIATVFMKAADGRRFYITPYGECSDCQESGYQWCWVDTSWHYCSLKPGYTTRNEKCINECNYYNYRYMWCYTENSWDYCSWVEESSRTEFTSNRNLCQGPCEIKHDHYECHIEGRKKFESCSPAAEVTSIGTACSSTAFSDNSISCGNHTAPNTDCCFTFANPKICDFCSTPTDEESFAVQLLKDANMLISEACKVQHYNGNVTWMKKVEVSYAMFWNIIITGVYVEQKGMAENEQKGNLQRRFPIPNNNTRAEAIIKVFEFAGATEFIKKSRHSVYTSNYGVFQVWNLEMNDTALAQVNILANLEFISKKFRDRLFKRAMYLSLVHGEIIWIFQKKIIKGPRDQLECPAEGSPSEDLPDEVTDGKGDKAVYPFVITSLDRLPFITKATYKIYTSEEKFPGVVFGFPIGYPVECHDPAWTKETFEDAFKKIRSSDLCLRMKWEISGYGDITSEVWSIASSRKGCIATPIKAEIRNCHYPLNSKEKLISGDGFENIDLEAVPDVNTTRALEEFKESNIPRWEPAFDKFMASLYNPCLNVYIKGKPVLKIDLLKDWRLFWFKSYPQYQLFRSFKGNTSTLIFIMPCFLDTDHSWVTKLRNDIITHLDGFIVITLEWTKMWNSWPWEYTTAVARTQDVGHGLSIILRMLKEDFPNTDFWGIGFGLGAHTLGRAGRDSGVLDRITGLDPSGPAFDRNYMAYRLTRTDAAFVEAIHSNSKVKPESDREEIDQFIFSCNNMNNQEPIVSQVVSTPFEHYGTSLKSGHLDFFVSPSTNFLPDGISPNPFGMDYHHHAKYLFMETVLKPRFIETDVELVKTSEADIITSNKCRRGGRIVEMGFHASPGVTGTFYIKATTGKDPRNWPSTPQPIQSQVDCRDLKNPRVISDGIGPGFFKKITVFVYGGQEKWEKLYEVYFDVVKMVSVITVHDLQTAPALKDETLTNDSEDTPSWFVRLCSHGLPYAAPSVRRGSADDSQLLPDLFYGRDLSGNEPGSEINRLGKEALSSLPEALWQFHMETHQMVPELDFNEANKQRATRLYINSAQQMATLYHSIYKALEEYIRDMATRRPLRIFTLSLNDHNTDPSNIGNSVPSQLIKVVVDTSTGCKLTFIVDNNLTKAAKYEYVLDVCPKALTDLLNFSYENDKRWRLHCYRKVTPNILDAVRAIHHQVYNELNKPNGLECTFF